MASGCPAKSTSHKVRFSDFWEWHISGTLAQKLRLKSLNFPAQKEAFLKLIIYKVAVKNDVLYLTTLNIGIYNAESDIQII